MNGAAAFLLSEASPLGWRRQVHKLRNKMLQMELRKRYRLCPPETVAICFGAGENQGANNPSTHKCTSLQPPAPSPAGSNDCRFSWLNLRS